MAELPAGFEVVRGWRAADTAAFTAGVQWEQPTIRIFGREHLAPRQVAWFGDEAYNYSGTRHEPAPPPPALAEARDAVERAAGARFNSVLLNRYRDGRDSVAWHADDEPELGAEPVIASWTLGAGRTFSVKPWDRRDRRRRSVILGDGDLLVMRGRSQADYLHSIRKTARPVGSWHAFASMTDGLQQFEVGVYFVEPDDGTGG